MAKTIAVFASDVNPRVDPALFYVTRADAAVRARQGRYRIFTATDDDSTIVALQLLPPPKPLDELAWHNGEFRSAWHQRPSAGVIVWQMRTR